MEDSNLENPAAESARVVARGPSAWRVALGVLISIATLGLTLILGFLSLCFGLLLSSSSSIGSSDRTFAFGVFAATLLVPIGGTWLAVHLFRGPKRSSAATAAVVSSVPSKELEERIFHLRIAVLIAILAHASVLILGVEFVRGSVYTAWFVTSLVSFVLYQMPYAVVLAGIATQPRRWAVSLALTFPIVSLCFAAFFYVWLFSPLRMVGQTFARNPLIFALGSLATVAVIVFAWRAWRAGTRSSDDTVRLMVFGLVSVIYLLLVQSLAPFVYKWVH